MNQTVEEQVLFSITWRLFNGWGVKPHELIQLCEMLDTRFGEKLRGQAQMQMQSREISTQKRLPPIF